MLASEIHFITCRNLKLFVMKNCWRGQWDSYFALRPVIKGQTDKEGPKKARLKKTRWLDKWWLKRALATPREGQFVSVDLSSITDGPFEGIPGFDTVVQSATDDLETQGRRIQEKTCSPNLKSIPLVTNDRFSSSNQCYYNCYMEIKVRKMNYVNNSGMQTDSNTIQININFNKIYRKTFQYMNYN